MSNLAFIFPGQGAQFIGMGKALAENFASARAVFEAVDEALGEKLTDIMWTEGNEEALTLTSNTQPSLMAVSVAVMAALEEAHGISVEAAKFVAGHSLGEYSALCAAGAMSVADTAKLLRIRGVANAGGVCEVANDNAPGQLVLSGTAEAIEAACVFARENGVKKAVPLSVSAPFHCSLMAPAADKMAAALAETEIKTPRVPLVANVSAEAGSDVEAIRAQLVEQVTGRVRWRESVAWMVANGLECTGEAGAGKVLTVMNRRNERALVGKTLGTPEDLAAFAESLNE